ncbi:hypothetical protein ACNSOO_04555 [Aliarcobacter lanthieri]|uniref:hypothetical protein n=1 Tax=Aliarcobacter lanthieri TaxID=1355374 RepID=UPI003AAE0DF0
MNRIDIFQDEEFIALPEEKKTEVLTNYFNKNMIDDDFNSLTEEKQTSIKQNFIYTQLASGEKEKVEVEEDNSFLGKVKDFGKTFVDNTMDTFVGARPFGTEDKAKDIKDKAFDAVFGAMGGVEKIEEPLDLEVNKNTDLHNKLKTEIHNNKEEENKKIENELIQDIENLSRVDFRLLGDATEEQKDNYLNNIAGILGKGGYALGQNDNNEYVAIDKDGNEKNIKNDFWESLLDGIKADAGEITGAIAGAKKGFDYSKNIKNPIGKAAAIAAGSLTGSVAGTSVDMAINKLKDRENLGIEDVLNELSKSAVLDIAGNAIGIGVVKVGGKILELPKKARDYFLNGNIDGAREILKKDLGIDEKYIEDALEQMKLNYKESENYSKNIVTEDENILSKIASKTGGNLRNKVGQQEELLAATLEKADANIIAGALDETAARNLSNTIDLRAKNIYEQLENKSSKIGGEEIKNYMKDFENSTKSNFSNMRKDFNEAFKEIDYKFELEELGLDNIFKDMSKRVQDPDAKKRFLTLQKAIKNTIYDSNAQSGITRDMGGLLDLRQQLNKFYGQNERYLSNAKDKNTFASLKENLDNQIYKAVNDNLPEDLATRLMDNFSKSMDSYRQLGELNDNKVFNSIMGDAKNPEFRMNNLVKHMADDDSYVDDVLSKMTPNARQTVEVAIIRDITDSYTAKTAQGQKAIAFEDLGKKLEAIKRNVRSELGKETIDNLITYAEKFGNRDLLFLDMTKGIKTKPTSNISTSLGGKIEMQLSSWRFDLLQRMMPTDTGKRLALQKHIREALHKSRTPQEFDTRLYEYPDLTDESREVLKSLIKNNNKILAAKNDKEAQDLLERAEIEKNKIFERETKLKEEIENFKIPDIYELRTVAGLTPDDKHGSFSQITTNISKGTATTQEIEEYIKARNNIESETLEKNILKIKYPINSSSVERLENFKNINKTRLDEIMSENEYNALVYNLKKDKLPNTTPEIEAKYREKFYALNKAFDEEKAVIKAQQEEIQNKAFEEADKTGLIPFANGETLGGAFFGGSEAAFSDRDYNGDGVNDIEDIAIGAIGGAIGFKALSKMFPNWFKNDEVGINANKLNKEKKNILKVAMGEKPSTILRKYDENEIINLSKGYHSDNENKGAGMHHIIVRHMKDDSNGKISLEELTQIGEVIRNGELTINNNKRVYTLNKNDVRFRAITGENENSEKVISFYSNRNINTGTEHDARNYTLSTSADDGVIITYKSQKSFKEWVEDIEKNDDGVVIGSFGGKSPIPEKNFKDSQGFYSVLEKTIDEKVGGKIDSVSLTKMLEKNGVKQDELEWSGLKNLLETKEKLTKEEIEEIIKENRLVLEKIEKSDKAKYKDYKTDGGENYRELLFTMQNENKKGYKSEHWDESNIVVFTRVDDRTIDNKKTLFIEELQSDWHQDGRKKGYGSKKVPDAPFKKNWHELGFKRMIQEAVENDYEKIAWTTGKQQTERYSLEKEIDTVIYNKGSGYIQASKNGEGVIFKKVANDEEVATLLGKEIANRLLEPKHSIRDNIFSLKGEELKFGGDGMKAFYDEIVPNTAKKLFKKYNVKPKIEELDDIEQMVWSVEITPKMKEDIKKFGQPLYAVGGIVAGYELLEKEDENE